jgi:hypothetical protein
MSYSGNRRLSLPMIETIENSITCDSWIEKINIRAKGLVKSHDENRDNAKSTKDLTKLSDLMKVDQGVLKEIEFLRNAKALLSDRKQTLINDEEETIKSYQYDTIEW